MRWIARYRSPSHLSWQIFRRTRGGKDLRAAARQRVQARFAKLDEHLLVGHPVEIGEECDLDGGEALQVNVGPDRLQPAQQILVVVERQLGMEPVDDVNLGERLVGALAELASTCSTLIVCAPGSPGRSRANAQNRHEASQTLVASSRRL